MSIKVPRGKSDDTIQQIIAGLEQYAQAHKKARIDIYRQNSVSVRIRVIDPDFKKLSKIERHKRIWEYLSQLPEDVQGDISMVVLLTPEETKKSLGNFEFDHPEPSTL